MVMYVLDSALSSDCCIYIGITRKRKPIIEEENSDNTEDVHAHKRAKKV